MLKERLSFEGGTSREMKKKIKEWIDETNDADLKKWLCAVTGGPSIPKEITLSFEKSDSFKYATCFHKVTIPTGQTPDEVIAEFNKVIENPNAGFNTR